MKAKVKAKFANILNRAKVPKLSVVPKTGQQVDEGNWEYKDTYTTHKQGEVVDVDEISFRNLSRKGVLEPVA